MVWYVKVCCNGINFFFLYSSWYFDLIIHASNTYGCKLDKYWSTGITGNHPDGLAKDCSNSSALGMELSQSHYNDVIMGTMASQITSLTIVYSIVYSDADQRKHQSSASLAFVRGIHRGPVNSPHKWPVTRKMFPFDDVIMLHWAVDL